VLAICEDHGVRDAFQARREAVNLKKVALGNAHARWCGILRTPPMKLSLYYSLGY
jgi:hypothetical protein